VTAITDDAEKLRELDLDTHLAWKAYTERLSGLEGAEYERAEEDCWDQLQRELTRLERRRKLLAGSTG
jgi:hypothetical protein